MTGQVPPRNNLDKWKKTAYYVFLSLRAREKGLSLRVMGNNSDCSVLGVRESTAHDFFVLCL